MLLLYNKYHIISFMTHDFPTASQVFGPDQVCRHLDGFHPLTQELNLSILNPLQTLSTDFSTTVQICR
jgi:hypothetical protein